MASPSAHFTLTPFYSSLCVLMVISFSDMFRLTAIKPPPPRLQSIVNLSLSFMNNTNELSEESIHYQISKT